MSMMQWARLVLLCVFYSRLVKRLVFEMTDSVVVWNRQLVRACACQSGEPRAMCFCYVAAGVAHHVITSSKDEQQGHTHKLPTMCGVLHSGTPGSRIRIELRIAVCGANWCGFPVHFRFTIRCGSVRYRRRTHFQIHRAPQPYSHVICVPCAIPNPHLAGRTEV